MLSIVSAQAGVDLAVTINSVPPAPAVGEGGRPSALTDRLLAALKNHGVPEVYGFFRGASLATGGEEARRAVQAWVDAAYPLGNMTYSSLDLNEVSASDFIADAAANELLLRQVSQGMHYLFFRFPFLREGNTQEKRDAVRAYLSENHSRIAPVTIDSEDWAFSPAYERCLSRGDALGASQVLDRFVGHAVSRLNHARLQSRLAYGRDLRHVASFQGSALVADSLDLLLSAWEDAARSEGGVRYSGLSRAMQDPAYANDPDVVTSRGGMTFLDRALAAQGIPYPDSPNRPDAWLGRVCLY